MPESNPHTHPDPNTNPLSGDNDPLTMHFAGFPAVQEEQGAQEQHEDTGVLWGVMVGIAGSF